MLRKRKYHREYTKQFITHGCVNSDGNPADPNIFISVYHQSGSADNFHENMQIFITSSNRC